MFNNVIVAAFYLMHNFVIKLLILLDYSINLLGLAGTCVCKKSSGFGLF